MIMCRSNVSYGLCTDYRTGTSQWSVEAAHDNDFLSFAVGLLYSQTFASKYRREEEQRMDYDAPLDGRGNG